MFLSAFLFYDRPAVVCKNFSDNSHHFFFFDSSRSYFSRAFGLRSITIIVYVLVSDSGINKSVLTPELLVLLVSINISQLKLLVFLVKSQNLWNVLKSKRPHRITFEKSCGFIRVHSYRQGSRHPPGSPPVRHPQRLPSGRPVHHFQAHPTEDRQIPPCSPLSPLALYPSLPS